VVSFKNFLNIFSIPELCKKIMFTLGVLIVFRLGVHIPVIGVDVEALHLQMQQLKGLGGAFAYIDILSGGMLRYCTLFALGIMPYISASIMMQMLSMTVPSFEALTKEGELGRKIINQYTRYLALGLSIFQSSILATVLERNNLVLTPGWTFRFLFVVSLVVGSMFVMWLGEQISLYGIGNGSSMLIFANIVSRFPEDIMKMIGEVQQGNLDIMYPLMILALFLFVAGCIVFLERGERKIPVQYSRRVVGQRVYGGQSSYIPFKLNTPGIMPVIFAGVMLNIPRFISTMLADRFEIFKWLSENLSRMGMVDAVLQFTLILVFSFLYTAMIFNPEEVAENIKKSGGHIPGVRPGKQTAEYFTMVLNRLGLVGALYLAALALLPSILYMLIGNVALTGISFLSGTSLLIMVGVALETAAQIESYLIEHRYEGLLTSGRFKARGAR